MYFSTITPLRSLLCHHLFSLYLLSNNNINLGCRIYFKVFSSKIHLLSDAQPPYSITTDVAFGVQDATKVFLTNGVAYKELIKISKDHENIESLTIKWRRMMRTFLGVQFHVISGLGYPANDQGLAMYNQHLAGLLQETKSTYIESLRVAGYRIWKTVLMMAFNISFSEIRNKSVNVLEARDIMHQISLKMNDPQVVDMVTGKCRNLKKHFFQKGVSISNKKHEIIQDIMVHNVYLSSPSLVKKLGFGSGVKGYIIMQIIIAEHQHDPVITQYIGSSMLQIFHAAEIDI